MKKYAVDGLNNQELNLAASADKETPNIDRSCFSGGLNAVLGTAAATGDAGKEIKSKVISQLRQQYEQSQETKMKSIPCKWSCPLPF